MSLTRFVHKLNNCNNFDLLDFHWVYPDAFAGLRWARNLNKKIIVTIRGNESICYHENSIRKKMLIHTLKSVDYIIAVSTDLKQKVVEEYGIKETKVTVIPNGANSFASDLVNVQTAPLDAAYATAPGPPPS